MSPFDCCPYCAEDIRYNVVSAFDERIIKAWFVCPFCTEEMVLELKWAPPVDGVLTEIHAEKRTVFEE